VTAQGWLVSNGSFSTERLFSAIMSYNFGDCATKQISNDPVANSGQTQDMGGQ